MCTIATEEWRSYIIKEFYKLLRYVIYGRVCLTLRYTRVSATGSAEEDDDKTLSYEEFVYIVRTMHRTSNGYSPTLYWTRLSHHSNKSWYSIYSRTLYWTRCFLLFSDGPSDDGFVAMVEHLLSMDQRALVKWDMCFTIFIPIAYTIIVRPDTCIMLEPHRVPCMWDTFKLWWQYMMLQPQRVL